MSTETFQLIFGLTLCTMGGGMLVYAGLRAHRRPMVMFGGLAALVGGIFWASSPLVVDAPERWQLAFGQLRALPYEAAVAYLCYRMVSSVGNKHPILSPIIATGIVVLPTLPILTAVVGVALFPQDAIATGASGSAELLVPRIRNFVEGAYLLLMVGVFGREALERSTPVLRLQNACWALASVGLLGVVLATLAVAAERLLIANNTESPMTTVLYVAQLASAGVMAVGFISGIALYRSAEHRERVLARYQDWIRRRYQVEDAAYRRFTRPLLDDSKPGARVIGYLQRAGASLRISPRELEQGRLTVALLALESTRASENANDTMSALETDQKELLEAEELVRRPFPLLAGNITYDLRDDDLYIALSAARRIRDGSMNGDHTNSPELWEQLAAVLAADAGFVPEPNSRSEILSGASDHATQEVMRSYMDAKRKENKLAHNSQDKI